MEALTGIIASVAPPGSSPASPELSAIADRFVAARRQGAALEGFPNPAQTERPVGVPLLPVAAGGSALATPTTGAGTPTPVAPAVQPAAPVRGAPVMVTPQR